MLGDRAREPPYSCLVRGPHGLVGPSRPKQGAAAHLELGLALCTAHSRRSPRLSHGSPRQPSSRWSWTVLVVFIVCFFPSVNFRAHVFPPPRHPRSLVFARRCWTGWQPYSPEGYRVPRTAASSLDWTSKPHRLTGGALMTRGQAGVDPLPADRPWLSGVKRRSQLSSTEVFLGKHQPNGTVGHHGVPLEVASQLRQGRGHFTDTHTSGGLRRNF